MADRPHRDRDLAATAADFYTILAREPGCPMAEEMREWLEQYEALGGEAGAAPSDRTPSNDVPPPKDAA